MPTLPLVPSVLTVADKESPSASAAADNTYQSKVLAALAIFVQNVKLFAVGAILAAAFNVTDLLIVNAFQALSVPMNVTVVDAAAGVVKSNCMLPEPLIEILDTLPPAEEVMLVIVPPEIFSPADISRFVYAVL